jgi:glycosyltransferase involved in cell wall biosynthesis
MVRAKSRESNLKHLQITPTFFANDSVIGGAERHAENLCKAVRAAAAERSFPIECEIVAFGTECRTVEGRDDVEIHILQGEPNDISTLDARLIKEALDGADIVHVHQCLTLFGLFVAAHAKLLGRRVIGTDHGGGEANHILHRHPEMASVYDALRAQSEFAALGFAEFGVRCEVMTGPVDDTTFGLGDSSMRDPKLILSVGRILPHKGFETIIDGMSDGLSLVVAGRPYDPEYGEFLRARAHGKRVYFEEELDDSELLVLMQKAGLYVHAGTHLDYRGRSYLKPELLGLAPLEFLCTGGRALVSRAGALRELGRLVGCTTFADAQDLRRLLDQYLSGQLETCAAAAVRNDVVGRYGLRQFGRRYLRLVEELNANPPSQ